MSENLRKYFSDLQFVSKIKCKKTKKILLKYLAKNPQIYSALKEIAVNVIKGNVEMDSKTKSKLRKHKKSICELAQSSKKCKNRKKLIVQSGGWLWILPVISTIIDLLK